jgi:large subunit ribosomal protein L23
MAFFDRFSKKQSGPPQAKPAAEKKTSVTEKETPTKETKEEKAAEKAAKKSKSSEIVRQTPRAGLYAHVLRKPHVSEKAAILAERGVYVFDVQTSANKTEIGKAVEAIYGVHVERVHTQRGIGKMVRRGKVRGQRNAWKKALVELKKGETISLVEGV